LRRNGTTITKQDLEPCRLVEPIVILDVGSPVTRTCRNHDGIGVYSLWHAALCPHRDGAIANGGHFRDLDDLGLCRRLEGTAVHHKHLVGKHGVDHAAWVGHTHVDVVFLVDDCYLHLAGVAESWGVCVINLTL